MTKKLWTLFLVLIVLILLLSGTSSFLFFKNRSLGKKAKTSVMASSSPEVAATAQSEPENTPSPQATTKFVSSGDRPSSPSVTHKVENGETLFSIATKYDLTWTQLTEANGIADADKIKAGETIIIPKDGQVDYTVDSAKVNTITKSVTAGKYSFRLDPVETAKTDAPPVYGLMNNSTYKLEAKDDKAGTATVTAQAGDRKITIKLSQPDSKGAQGIWAIVSIAVSE